MDSKGLSSSIQLFCSTYQLADAARTITATDGRVFEINLEKPQTEEELVRRFFDALQAPWAATSFDALVSLGSELYWVDGARRFLMTVTGVKGMPADLARDFSAAIVRIVDRMRTAGDRYTVMFPVSESSDELLVALRQANESLSETPAYSWIRHSDPVPIIDHRDGPPVAS